MKPSVSINLCCYNSEKYLRETLQSIVNQTYKDWELVIINDGSSDSTESIIFEFIDQGYPIIYYYQENKGLGASRNRAIEFSQGKYIAFIDHDDIWLPQKLEKQIPLFEKKPKVGLVFSDDILFNNKGIQKRRLTGRGKFYRGHVFKELLNNYFISMPTSVIKRETLFSLSEWFDDRFQLIEEVDLFIRIAHDWEVDYVDEALSLYRVHKNSSTWSKKELLPYEYEIMLGKYNHLYPELATDYQIEITKMRRYIQYQYALIDWENGNKYNARKIIRPYIFTSKKYLTIYFLMFFPYYLFWKIKSYLYVMPD